MFIRIIIILFVIIPFANAQNYTVVAIIDSPIDTNHEMLSAAIDENIMDSLKTTDEDGNEISWKDLNNQIAQELKSKVKSGQYKEQVEFLDNMTRLQGNQQNIDYKVVFKGLFKYLISKKYRKQLGLIGIYLHGTHVAGLAIKSLANVKLITYPFYGVPKKVKSSEIWNFDEENLRKEYRQKWETVSKGLISSNVKVVNLSLGSDEKAALDNLKSGLNFFGRIVTASKLKKISQSVARIYQEEFQRFINEHPDRAFVVAAGNSKTDISDYNNNTAKVTGDNVIVVGATNRADEISVFSNYSNKYTDIAVLGTAVKSALAEGGEISMSGSSMAAPIVTNEILRRMQENPKLNPVEAIQIVLENAKQSTDLQSKVVQGRVIPYELVIGGSIAAKEAPEHKVIANKPFSEDIISELIEKIRTESPTKVIVEFSDTTVTLLSTKIHTKLIEISRLSSKVKATTNPALLCLGTKINL